MGSESWKFEYVFIFLPAILFGTVLSFGPWFLPLQIVSILGMCIKLRGFPFRVAPGKARIWFCIATSSLFVYAVFNVRPPHLYGSIAQVGVRFIYVVYAFLLFVWMSRYRANASKATNVSLFTLLTLFAYGWYEMIAKIWHFPLFLSFLLNNPSYSISSDATSAESGWINYYRSQSVWPEPSFALLPIMLYFTIIDREGKKVSPCALIFILGFGIFTFSRIVWVGLLLILMFRSTNLKKISRLLGLIFVIAAFAGLLGNTSGGSDRSLSMRVYTTLDGFNLAWNNPVTGIGFNTYRNTAGAKETGESVIHNTVANYFASMGIPLGGAYLLTLIIPFFRIRQRQFPYLFPLIVMLLFGVSDAFYFTPIFFLMVYANAKNIHRCTVVSKL